MSLLEMTQNVVAAAAWWLLAGNAIVLGCAVLLEFAPRSLRPVSHLRGAANRLHILRPNHNRPATLPYAAYNLENGEQTCAASAAEPMV